MGRNPKDNADYIRICQERQHLALTLRDLFEELRKAYLEERISDGQLGKQEQEALQRRVLEEEKKDAMMLQEHYRKLRNK